MLESGIMANNMGRAYLLQMETRRSATGKKEDASDGKAIRIDLYLLIYYYHSTYYWVSPIMSMISYKLALVSSKNGSIDASNASKCLLTSNDL